MGYFEHYCQLCGVSFAIARFRRIDEPEEAAWSYIGSGYNEATDDDQQCEDGSGCIAVKHQEGEDIEHVAGPGCTGTQGYSGYRISVEEMEGCRTIQCLVPKTELDDWASEDDDEDFERDGKYFLTGYGDGSPDEAPLEITGKVRHGLDDLLISNNVDSVDGQENWGLPFHPTCFEIFKKLSVRRFGHVDASGLFAWRTVEGTFDTFHEKFPRHPAVRDAQEQWWNHEPGSEWLVANPVRVLALAQLLRRQNITWETYPHDRLTQYTSGWKGLYPGTDGGGTRRPKPASGNSDLFETLPRELLDRILEFLPSKSVATLRLVTRAAEHIPTTLFRGFMFEDMPWFWEAESLPPTTDWSRLYFQLRFSWGELKGLKNRKRIWKDVNYIVDRIVALRAKGDIKD